ncbi:prephenate dehydrogenase [Parapusillimonas granuli]|uniref:Prephenate dehydrogenase/arogenate dehydrogenase family protein n=1 Tax=Parapusillimonas granuli TaxID=380911 RepID=A0A853G1H2_9BURK|nr:prephenate dehydrogenase/arogenate dehydrogenase family protein [Parapusillimonas granuli]MBB5217108.1 prephenate dehydrogenase [Parapusillimonas granuli]MEB2401573.1 prephenate dehydrogenase/arogenate dehydrogenase family protein [Alcaligenaceae bacterium]NYT50129.1 prephenate dehydrogenase/arogenate dehydrogenase family protein [Parapusillimonas granuli]
MSQAASGAAPLVPVLAVVGVGLIGGSFAAALRKQGAVGRILGVGRQRASVMEARKLGLIDEIATLEQAAAEADLIMLSAPVGATRPLLEGLLPFLRADTLITDAGSTKADVVKAAHAALGDRVGQFIPGHPVAGAEKAGPEAADPMLYRGRKVVLTPLPQNRAADRERLQRIWEACGAQVMVMEPEVHDKVLASVSHVPHFLSSVFMWQVATAADSDLRMALAASGFRDFTRISAGSAEVWRDIFLSNRAAVLSELREVKEALARAEQALEHADGPALEKFLERAATARRLWGSRSGM